MEKLSGKTALVTGSTDGVGRLVARKLGQVGARVLVHGRDAERGARIVTEIEAGGGAATFHVADLSALAEMRRLAGAVQATVNRLDILINNAGIGTAGPRQTSAEGFELRFAVNYLAGFLLTSLLLPFIKNSAGADRERRVCRTTAYRLRRRHADPQLQRDASLLPEQAGSDHVYSGSRGFSKGYGCHGHLPSPRHLHGYEHGAAGWSEAAEHGRGRRASDPQSRHITRSRGAERALFQRPA
jgi:NAD(P)-dependent dehydrogenase (short-subunit alcohol dehydrogenase family)